MIHEYIITLLSSVPLVLLVILLTLYYIYVLKDSYWQSRGIPCEKPLPFFGNFKSVILQQCNASTLITNFYNKFKGPYFGMSLLNKNVLVLKDPELIKNVLIRDFNVFDNRDFASNEKADAIAFNTLFSTPNPKWKALRSKISPVFTSGKIKLMFNLMKDCADDLVNFMDETQGKVVEMKDVCSKYTTDVITSCAFGINANSFKSDKPEFYNCSKRIFGEDVKNTFAQFCYFFLPLFVDLFKLKFIEAKAANFFSGAFWETVENRKRSNVQRNDLIDILNKLKNDSSNDEFIFDDQVMVSQAIVFFSAGQETTSSLISFILYEIVLQPQIQKRLRDEIFATIQKHGEFTYESVNEMKYLDMVIQEGLRKYPLAPFLNRKSSQKYTFETTGFTIEKDTPVLIPLSGLHYDEKYFPESEKFDPERFSPENKDKIVPYTYLPFGDGPRNCIGARFGLVNAKVGLVHILKNFEIERCDETQVPLKISKTANLLRSEKGIFLKYKKFCRDM